jgi:hypothetical protein
MLTNNLKTILTAAGCTRVFYESKELANIVADGSLKEDIVGMIIQPTTVKLEVKGNGITEHFPPLTVEIMQQVRLEDSAENNEPVFSALLEICKGVMNGLVSSGEYGKIGSIEVTKILETRYDQNFLGWSMPLDLPYPENKNNC